MVKETILVTSALPYANGAIHFGHIAGAYLPADVFVRFHRLKKNDVVYICGTDEYGVAITINAEKEKKSPKEHVDHYHEVIKNIFSQFNISFDHFSRTTTEKHSELSQKFFKELYDNGHIESKVIEQFFCEDCDMFLADRYITGTCYVCSYEGVRGDECPQCGEWLEPLKIKNPKCKVCGENPIVKSTKHWFLRLDHFKQQLLEWIKNHPEWKSNVVNAAIKQIDHLESRPITRDIKWGVPVPLEEAKDKVLYVWFDAPIGYMDATMEWAEKIGEPLKWKDYWQNEQCRIVNFIGKDNIPFHLLVWPSMILGQTTKYTLADNVPANEFLNLEGKQFSKSENWTIDLEDFFKKYTADQIRFNLAYNAPETKDSDFAWDEFKKNNNSDCVGVLGNLVNRLMTFTHKNFDGNIPCGRIDEEPFAELQKEIKDRKNRIAELYNSYQLKKAAFEIIELARMGNKFFDENEPWKLVKTDQKKCGEILFCLFYLLEQLAVVCAPLLPDTSQKIIDQMGFDGQFELLWDLDLVLKADGSQKCGKTQLLFKKIDDKQIELEKEKLTSHLKMNNDASGHIEQLQDHIDFGDVMKLDLRVGEILKAEKVPKSKKLLKLLVDIGLEKRTIVAGISEHYEPKQVIGKKVVIAANLKPKKLMNIESQGMVLAASIDDQLSLVEAQDSLPGARVK